MDQQVEMIESFGVNISDQMYAQLEAGIARSAYTTPIVAGDRHPARRARSCAAIILGIWGMLLGGAGTFKQVYAILAHSGIIFALSVLFAMPLSYATRPAGRRHRWASSCRCSRRRASWRGSSARSTCSGCGGA